MGIMGALVASILPKPHAYTSWTRYHQVARRTRDGRTMEHINLEKPKPITYVWGAEAARDVNRKLMDDAAMVLGVNRSRIILLDLGRERTAWVENGNKSDFVRYVHTGGSV